MTGDYPFHQGPVLPTGVFEGPFSEPVPGSTPFGVNILTWRTKKRKNTETATF
jgi:hypothetical protein